MVAAPAAGGHEVAAEETVAGLRQRCVNTLQAVAHIYLDATLCAQTRVAHAAMKPLEEGHTRDDKAVKAEEIEVDLYSRWAQSAYMEDLYKCTRVAADLSALDHMGVEVLFADGALEQMQLGAPRVLQDDWLAAELVGFLLQLLQQRLLSQA